jgi:hypothetical protein
LGNCLAAPSKCPNKEDRYYRKCRCAVSCEGTVEAESIRQALKTRSWERGVELARYIEDGKKETKEPSPSKMRAPSLSGTPRHATSKRLRSVFKWFLEADLIPKNPAAGIKCPITHETAVEPFSRDEQEKILATA